MVSAILMVLSASWLAILTLAPEVQSAPAALAVTGAALLVNGLASFALLIFQKRISFLLNLLQILLFAMVHGQIYLIGGADYYDAARATEQFDWQMFAWSHALHAADLVHLLEDSWSLNPIEQHSTVAGVL